MVVWAHLNASATSPLSSLMQIAAMDRDVGEAVAGDRLGAKVEQLPGLAGVPQPDFLAGRNHLHRGEIVLEPERMQHPRAVGADLDAGADLAQFFGLLVDRDIDATPQQRQRGSEPPDAAPDDCDRP